MQTFVFHSRLKTGFVQNTGPVRVEILNPHMASRIQQSTSILPRVLEGIRTFTAQFRSKQITPTTPPTTVTDAHNQSIEIRSYTDDDYGSLVSMYGEFDQSQRAQGVPPLATEEIREWLTDILGGVNVVACHEGRIIGHVSFVKDGTGRHELAIFVHQDYQQAGVGSRLMAAGLGHARENDVCYVWLSVERTKRYQQRFYNRAGFSAVNPFGLEMRMSRSL